MSNWQQFATASLRPRPSLPKSRRWWTAKHGRTSRSAEPTRDAGSSAAAGSRPQRLPSPPPSSGRVPRAQACGRRVTLAGPRVAAMATPGGTVFTPQRLLLLFCCINMLVYLDRGAALPSLCAATDALVKVLMPGLDSCDGSAAAVLLIRPTQCTGVISSNGVNGAANQPGRPGTGIQVGLHHWPEPCGADLLGFAGNAVAA